MASRDCAFSASRFIESLVLWDLSRADKLAEIRPGLAESWEQDKADQTKWIFHLRQGVKFHDSSDFNADAAIWNLDRYFKQDAPQSDPPGAAFDAGAQSVYRQLPQDRRLYGRDRQPAADQLLPNMLHLDALCQPGAVQEDRLMGRVREVAGGHGPVQDRRVQAARQRDLSAQRRLLGQQPGAETRQDGRVPDAGSRRPDSSALRSGQVDWIEVPPPDAVPSLKSAGFEIVTNSYPHAWPWTFNLGKPDWPLRDIRVRHAINYCINRDGLVTLLNGLAEPAAGSIQEGRPVFRQPEAAIRSTTPTRQRRC